jgi:autotransporter-associated beta strand protein
MDTFCRRTNVMLGRGVIALAVLAGIASAAWSQTIPTPRTFGTLIPSVWTFSSAPSEMPIGPALPSHLPVTVPLNANGASPFYPTQVQQAYGINALLAAGNNGAGQTIAIIGAYHYPNALSAINTFSAGYNSNWTLPTMSSSGSGPTLSQISATSVSNSGWAGEEALDMDYVHAMAPMANIILYEAKSNSTANLFAMVDAARQNPAVSVITMSWGGGETTAYDSTLTTPGTRGSNGVTFCASTGDSGAPGGYPAFSPNVVAVGGSSLYLTTANNYSSETAWSWSSANNWGGGGGTSTVEAKPLYQISYGTAHPSNILHSTTSRAMPDVSMNADPVTGVYVYDSYNGGWKSGVGGTSLSSPCFAGLVAIANQIRANAGRPSLSGSQTLSALYSLPSGDFHDITSGNIDPLGSPNFSAGPGYDLATGLGSPIANLLVPDLASFGAAAISTSYSLTTSAAAVKIHIASAGSFTITSLSGSIANTGSSGAGSDALTYSGFGLRASGGTSSGGTLPLSAGTLAAGLSASGTTTFSSNTAGSFTITPTATSVLNLSASGTPTLSASNATTVAVYRLAAAGTIAGLNFSGNHHLGDSVAPQFLTVNNTATNDGYSESLDARFSGSSSGLTVSGSALSIGPGGSNSTALQVGINTGSVGPTSGTLSVALTSNGAGSSGLGSTALGAQTVAITGGTVYRLASANTIANPMSLGGVRVNGSFAPQSISVMNAAAADGYSEGLNVSIGSVSGGASTNGGSIYLLSPGSFDGASIVVGLGGASTSTPGQVSGTVGLALASDGSGSSALGTTPLSGQTLTLTGTIYRYAAGTLTSGTDIALGAIRQGEPAVQSLTVSNTAAADGYSDNLGVLFGSPSGALSVTADTTGVAAGGSGTAGTLAIPATIAGPLAGSVAATLLSIPTASGLDTGHTFGQGQTISMSGTAYRYAAGTLTSSTSMALGAIRQGVPAVQNLTVSNTAAADGYSDNLGVLFGTPSGALSVTADTTGVAAGGSGAAATLTIPASSAGPLVGSVVATLLSIPTASGLDTGHTLGQGQTINISGTAYRYAAGTLASSTSMALGSQHLGASGGTLSGNVSVINTAAADGYSDNLGVLFGTPSGALSAYADPTGVAAGSSSAAGMISVNLNTAVLGLVSGSVATTLLSIPTVAGPDTGHTLGQPQTMVASGNVFSGNALWTSSASSAWAAHVNWGDTATADLGQPGAPGITAGFDNIDTAAFDASQAVGSVTSVQLGGASPSLAGMIFRGPSGYTVQQGSGGSGVLVLKSGSGTATINASGGAGHTIGAPLTLANDLQVTVDDTAILAISGPIGQQDATGRALTKTGSGTLILTGANTYSGATTVGGGMLVVAQDNPATSFTANSGGTLQFTAATLNLGSRTITANAGGTVQYVNATLGGGHLAGPGTHAALPAAMSSFIGVAIDAGTLFSQDGPAAFTNVASAGVLINNSPLSWDGGINALGGSLVVNSSVGTDEFVSAGAITINSGGAINNSQTSLTVYNGAVVTVNSGGTLNADSQAEGVTLNLQDCRLVNNGTLIGTTNVGYGATLSGSGTFGLINLLSGAALDVSNNGGLAAAAVSVFGGSIAGGGAVAAPLTVHSASLLANPGDELVLSGGLSGDGTLTKLGAGSVVLGNGSFAGSLSVLDGALIVTGADALADGTNVAVGDAGMFPAHEVLVPAVSAAVAAVPEPNALVLLLATAGTMLLTLHRARRRGGSSRLPNPQSRIS